MLIKFEIKNTTPIIMRNILPSSSPIDLVSVAVQLQYFLHYDNLSPKSDERDIISSDTQSISYVYGIGLPC